MTTITRGIQQNTSQEKFWLHYEIISKVFSLVLRSPCLVQAVDSAFERVERSEHSFLPGLSAIRFYN